MATPISIGVPPLRENQTIKSWRPLFQAAVSTLLQGEGGQKTAIRLLPAFVNRGTLECTIALKALEKDTLDGAFEYLIEHLDPETDEHAAAERFREMTWPPGEAITNFAARYMEEGKAAQLRPKQICRFLATQLPQEARPKLREWLGQQTEELTEDGALKMATEIRKVLLSKGIPLDRGYRGVTQEKVFHAEERPYKECSATQGSEEEREEEVVYATRTRGARAGKDTKPRAPELKCFGCGGLGHFIRNCPNRRKCTNCGRVGHRATECRSKRKHYYADATSREAGGGVYQVSGSDEAVTLKVLMERRKVAAILDTGASPCVIDKATAEALGLNREIVRGRSRVYGLCSNPVEVLGHAMARIQVGTLEPMTQKVHILDNEEPTILLGRQFMRRLGPISFDFLRGKIMVGGVWQPYDASVQGETPLARAQVVKQDEKLETDLKGTRPIVNPELPDHQYGTLARLTDQFDTAFTKNPKRPSRTTLPAQHAIITEDALPQRSRPRRVPPKWEDEINRQLEEMLASEPPIVRPSSSPWASDVVLVKKKDGNLRFAVDYRRLNAVTKRDEYSLPNPNSIFDKLQRSTIFSKLDVASAYWTIPIRRQDTEKTAFHTPRGLFEMLMMPFGLCNSQATFQRLMDQALSKLSNVESYVDDILVYSRSFDEYVLHLTRVLERLEEAGLRLRRDKCQLGYGSMEFLGHWVSQTGRGPLRSYLDRMQEFRRPQSVAELQRFLGTVNYYRCYIKDISQIAEPLYALTRKGSQWVWNERCEEAFQYLRRTLVREPIILAFPNWDEPFHIETDACGLGVGAVLGQIDRTTGKVRPIYYYSASLSPSQRNYSAGQLETWAIRAATRKWSVYLNGAEKVVIHTDHSPLKWLQSQKDPKPTVARWLMELQELNLEITVRAGSDNAAADYFSRNPIAEYDEETNSEENFEERIFLTGCTHTLAEQVVEGQLDDLAIRGAIRQLEEKGQVAVGKFRRVSKYLRVVNGRLLFNGRIVVSRSRNEDVMRAVHAQHHFGVAGTHSLRKSFFWVRMRRDVERFCRNCLTCHRSKPTNEGKEPIGVMLGNEGIPGHAVGIDVGTLPWSEDGYRYFLLMVDLFTRYIEIQPLKDQCARTLVEAFERGWIYRGYGVPQTILSDQGKNVDGETFREFCKILGVEKKRTSPYRPQADGMSERNIGMVKQVIRCLQEDRHLDKGSWPGLLAEVSFHCNGMPNGSTRISPHMLTFSREPQCPLEAWCRELKVGETNTHSEHLEALIRKQDELRDIAKENADRNLRSARERHNRDRVESQAEVGDYVFLKRQSRTDSLSLKFDGPFLTLARRAGNVKLRLPRRDKWVHLDNCKLYRGDMPPLTLQQPLVPKDDGLGRAEGSEDDSPPSSTGEF